MRTGIQIDILGMGKGIARGGMGMVGATRRSHVSWFVPGFGQVSTILRSYNWLKSFLFNWQTNWSMGVTTSCLKNICNLLHITQLPVDPIFRTKTWIRAKRAKWPKKCPNFGIMARFLKMVTFFFFNNNKAIAKITFKRDSKLHCSVSYKYTNMIGAWASL